MLLVQQRVLPRGSDWSYELKMDGYRLLATTGSAPRLRTKEGADATVWFPEVVAALALLPSGSILDGEVVVMDDIGRPDFNRLHARAMRRRWYPGADHVAYCVFDMLAVRGQDIRAEPIERRRAALKRLLTPLPDGLLLVTSVDDGVWLYQQVLALGLEGVVCKRAGSTYQSGVRSTDWVKVKRPGAVPPGRFKR